MNKLQWEIIATALLLFVVNLKPAFGDHMHRDFSFPWEWLPFAVVYRNGILFPWGQFYYIPDLLESPLVTTTDPPDPPDPVPQKNKNSKKVASTKTAVKKTKQVNSEQEFEQENESENPQPRKNKRKGQRKGQRKRKRKGQKKGKTAR